MDRKEINKRYYEKNKERIKARTKKWYRENPDRVQGIWLKRKYWPNLSWQEALEKYRGLLKATNYCCQICHYPQQNGARLCIDHNHRTGEVRGILCARCNLVIGNANENWALLENLSLYLQRSYG